MIAKIVHRDSGIHEDDYKFYDKFIKFLQEEYPLENDVEILFLSHREGHMTTGSRSDKHFIKVLTKNRLNRDILRTLAHEWIHEYESTELGFKKGPDIGGRNENLANTISGILVKKFEKKYPKLEPLMYH